MIKCGKFLTIKKEGSANQSEGCGAFFLFVGCFSAFHRETGSIDD